MTGPFDRDDAGRFSVEAIPDRERIVIVPRGEIDVATVGRVRELVGELEMAGFDYLVLDLREVTFIDSSGLRLVLEEVWKDDLDFAVIPGNDLVQRAFDITGLTGVVPLVKPWPPGG